MLLTLLLPLLVPHSSFAKPGSFVCNGSAPTTLGPPTSLIHQENVVQICLPAHLREAFSPWRFLFPDNAASPQKQSKRRKVKGFENANVLLSTRSLSSDFLSLLFPILPQ